MLDWQLLLRPFLSVPLTAERLRQCEIYLDLLLKWNAKISLTAIRDPEDIVRRHFGESLFVAQQVPSDATTLADFGSGAGFPGLPIAVVRAQLQVTLIESQQKKVTFLREAIRTLQLTNVHVHARRGEDVHTLSQIVTMRAVEKFDDSLPTAARLLAPGASLFLLIGASQCERARNLLPNLQWTNPLPIPESRERVLIAGKLAKSGEPN